MSTRNKLYIIIGVVAFFCLIFLFLTPAALNKFGEILGTIILYSLLGYGVYRLIKYLSQ